MSQRQPSQRVKRPRVIEDFVFGEDAVMILKLAAQSSTESREHEVEAASCLLASRIVDANDQIVHLQRLDDKNEQELRAPDAAAGETQFFLVCWRFLPVQPGSRLLTLASHS